MQVVNLVSWAGAAFSHVPGDLIELPDDVAGARIAAGLARPVSDDEPPRDDERLPDDEPVIRRLTSEDGTPTRRGPGRPRR